MTDTQNIIKPTQHKRILFQVFQNSKLPLINH